MGIQIQNFACMFKIIDSNLNQATDAPPTTWLREISAVPYQ